MTNEWTMTRRADSCVGCGRSFDVGDLFTAYLYEAPPAGPARENDGPTYERRDYCTSCRPPETPPQLACWKARRPAPATKKQVPFDREGVLQVFDDLAGAPEPDRQRFRFVLALLLWRRKVIKFDRTEPMAGGERWRFHLVGDGRQYEVVRPDLDETEIERLSEQLEQVVAGGSGIDDVRLGEPSGAEHST